MTIITPLVFGHISASHDLRWNCPRVFAAFLLPPPAVASYVRSGQRMVDIVLGWTVGGGGERIEQRLRGVPCGKTAAARCITHIPASAAVLGSNYHHLVIVYIR